MWFNWWFILRSLLFLFPAEFTHALAKVFILASARFSFKKKAFRQIRPSQSQNQNKNQNKNWLNSLNPVGLAAGFDKNAELLTALPHFGFGFAEIGTVTPKPQGGNDRPRLFRDSKTKNIFNRMGFNNLGAGIVSERVRRAKPHLPPDFKVGINLGKNKLTSEEETASDYVKVARAFLDCADYFVINVSSPNTPGLRSLQNPKFLLPILKAVQDEVGKNCRPIPILVKLAPELDFETLQALIPALEMKKVDGLVLTNTLAGDYIYRQRKLSGGYSGQILSSISQNQLQLVRSLTTLPLISVGGISSAEDARIRFRLGADAVQIYTGWVFEGPYSIRKIVKNLLK